MADGSWYGAWRRHLAAAPGPPSSTATPWLLGAAGAALGAALVLWLAGGYQAGFLAFNHWSASLPPALWEGLTVLGDERLALGLVVLAARPWPRLFWALIIGALLGLLASQAIKYGVGARRPPAVLLEGSFQLLGPRLRQQSFPSGHTLTVFFLAGVGLYWVSGWGARLGLLVLAALAGLSRVALGVHWPLDVCAGAVLGLAAAWLGVWIASRWTRGPPPWLHLLLMLVCASFPLRLVLGEDGRLTEVAALLPWVGFAILARLIWDIVQLGFQSRRD